MITHDETIHVVLLPHSGLKDEIVKEVSTITHKNLFEIRLLLAGKIPRVLSQCKTFQEAESVTQKLKALGLRAFVCPDSELQNVERVHFEARSIKIIEGTMAFISRSGVSKTLRSDECFLILEGIKETRVEKETTKTGMKLNLPATLVTGGIPIMRKVKEKTVEKSIQNEYFVRLYRQASSEPFVHISQLDLDYSFLDSKIALSSLANINTVVKEIKSLFPEAISDNSLTASGTHISPSKYASDLDVNCKLIFLSYLYAQEN